MHKRFGSFKDGGERSNVVLNIGVLVGLLGIGADPEGGGAERQAGEEAQGVKQSAGVGRHSQPAGMPVQTTVWHSAALPEPADH